MTRVSPSIDAFVSPQKIDRLRVVMAECDQAHRRLFDLVGKDFLRDLQHKADEYQIARGLPLAREIPDEIWEAAIALLHRDAKHYALHHLPLENQVIPQPVRAGLDASDCSAEISGYAVPFPVGALPTSKADVTMKSRLIAYKNFYLAQALGMLSPEAVSALADAIDSGFSWGDEIFRHDGSPIFREKSLRYGIHFPLVCLGAVRRDDLEPSTMRDDPVYQSGSPHKNHSFLPYNLIRYLLEEMDHLTEAEVKRITEVLIAWTFKVRSYNRWRADLEGKKLSRKKAEEFQQAIWDAIEFDQCVKYYNRSESMPKADVLRFSEVFDVTESAYLSYPVVFARLHDRIAGAVVSWTRRFGARPDYNIAAAKRKDKLQKKAKKGGESCVRHVSDDDFILGGQRRTRNTAGATAQPLHIAELQRLERGIEEKELVADSTRASSRVSVHHEELDFGDSDNQELIANLRAQLGESTMETILDVVRGFSDVEIADRQGITVDGVKKRLQRARKRFPQLRRLRSTLKG